MGWTGGNTEGSVWTLVVQDHAQEATMDRRQLAVVVIDEAKPLELIHEMTDPRPGGADHLGQAFLIDAGNYSFGPAVLAKMSQQ